MSHKLGTFIVMGLVIGSIFGVSFGAALDNIPLGIALGAIGGVFVAWFAAAAVLEKQNETRIDKKR